jgi:hypothetical protein
MASSQQYVTEIKDLIKAYGLEVVAKLLDKTGRGVQYWISDTDPKTPGPNTIRTIHELHVKHVSGINLVQEPTGDYKDKYIASLERENARLQRDLDLSLGELRHNSLLTRAMLETTQELLFEVLAGKNKKLYAEIADSASIRNGEKYQRLKEEGNFPFVGK